MSAAVSVSTKNTMMQSFVFQNVPEPAMDTFLVNAKETQIADAELVYDVGDIPKAVYFVLKGAVRMEVPMPDGESFFLGMAPATTLFGEHEALCETSSAARISAAGDTRLVVIPKGNFLKLFQSEPVFSQTLAKKLATTMRMLIMAAAYHYNSSADKKLASLLIHLSDQLGCDSESGRAITIKLSQDEIAQMLSTTRQTVNKYLQAWRKQGWIAIHQGVIEILDIRSLEQQSSLAFLKELRENYLS